MKKHHATIVLLTLFFTGLIVLWWADYAGIPTSQELEATRGLVLPELRKVATGEIRRIEIAQHRQEDEQVSQPPTRLVFERRDSGWQMLEPVNAAADPSRVETIAQNVKNLLKSPEAGTIHDPPARYGLEPPAATVKVFGADEKAPLATLEIGKAVRDRLYVRAPGKAGIEVVDSRLFKGIGEPAPEWRERSIFNLATFQIGRLAVSRAGHELKLERREGRWRLLQPIAVLADDFKIEEVLGELTSLRVQDGVLGFVADDVRDLSRYSLDRDHATRIEVTPTLRGGKPQVLLVGKPAEGHEGRVYALRGDQDDVVLINGKGVSSLGVDPNALRSKKVTDFNPALASFLRIESHGGTFDLARTSSRWVLTQPVHEPADQEQVANLLARLAELETSEFLPAEKARGAELDQPAIRLKLWQLEPGQRLSTEPAGTPSGQPQVDLRLGRRDASKKTVFARLEGDSTVLALPELILDALPENQLAYRERVLLQLGVGLVSRLTIEDGRQKIVLAHARAGNPNQWAMEEPIASPANDESVTKALLVLSNLRALRLITDRPGAETGYGLATPSLRVSWSTAGDASREAPDGSDSTASLILGARVPRSEAWYARLSTSPLVFTISDALVLPFRAEFHSPRVLTFPLKKLERLTLRWPDRSLSFDHHPTPRGGVSDWDVAAGSRAAGFDLSRINSLASDLSRLQTRRYLQYTGPFPAAASLDHPRLQVELRLKERAEPIVLRVGNTYEGSEFFATTDSGSQGTVFVLSGPGWSALVQPQSTPAMPELPADVFSPAPAKASQDR